jgi:MFS family permease
MKNFEVNDSVVQSTIATKLWLSACLIGLSSFMYGYSITALNSCLVFGNAKSGIDCYNKNDDGSCPPGTIYDDLELSPFEASLATSLTIVGAWIGSYLGAVPAERFGRRLTLLGNSALYITGSILAADGNFISLCVGRFLSGLGVGITSAVAPVTLSEIAADAHRGTITTFHQLFVTIGVFTAFTVSYGLVTFVHNGWQYVQGLGAVAPTVMLLCSPWVPESPKWIMGRRNDREWALRVLITLRNDSDNVEAELDSYASSNSSLYGNSSASGVGSTAVDAAPITYSDVIRSNGLAVFIGCGLMFFQAMCGISSIILYSTTIFGFADFTDALLGTMLVGCVNVSTTVLGAFLIERVGRKALFQGGTLL